MRIQIGGHWPGAIQVGSATKLRVEGNTVVTLRRVGCFRRDASNTARRPGVPLFIFGRPEAQTNIRRRLEPVSKSVSSAYTLACDLEPLEAYVLLKTAETQEDSGNQGNKFGTGLRY
jgi:hypothetical protein